MLIINLISTVLIPLILGIFLLSILIGKRADFFNFWEKIALSLAIGLGYLTIIMFLMALIKIPISYKNIILTISLIITAALIYLSRVKIFCFNLKELKQVFQFNFHKIVFFEYFLIILILLKILYVFFSAIAKPLIDVDAFQQYSIVAKGIFYKETFLTPYLLSFIHDKPLFPFIIQGWAFLGLHTTNDAWFKIFSPLLFICLIIIFYSSLNKYFSRKPSLLFTFFLATLPFLTHHATTAYADLTQTFYYAASTIYLFLFMKKFSLQHKDEAFSYFAISMVLLGLSVWVKRGGIFLAGINILALTGYLVTYRKMLDKANLKKLIIFTVVFILIITPWIAYGQAQTLIGTLKQIFEKVEIFAPSAIVEGPLLDTEVVFLTFLRKLFLYADWHLLWLLFVTTLIFFYKKTFRRPLIFLLAIILLDISILFIQFRFGGSFMWILDGTLLDRLVMNYVPIVLYFCAEVLNSS